jgi:hypothetical protein
LSEDFVSESIISEIMKSLVKDVSEEEEIEDNGPSPLDIGCLPN